jgi:hypothetical protein
VRFLIELPIAKCQLPISNRAQSSAQIGNWELKIGNIPETPNRGQGAKCPDRFFRGKAANSSIKFFGSNDSALNTPLT